MWACSLLIFPDVSGGKIQLQATATAWISVAPCPEDRRVKVDDRCSCGLVIENTL